MPTLTRWYVKTALIYFIASLLIGLLLVLNPLYSFPPVIASLSPLYFHMFMVGWVAELIIGVVNWMFPKYSQQHPRGNERLGWATYVLLNVGLLLRVIGEPLLAVNTNGVAGGLVAVAAVLQMFAGWAFVLNTWGRVKER